jgi:Domain of unknown function (DUF4440)
MAHKTIEQELVELERKYWQAIKEKDVDAALRLTDDPCIITGAQGITRVDRQTLASMLQAATWTLDKFELSDEAQVRLLRDDVAIVAYNSTLDKTRLCLTAAASGGSCYV